jgi:serine/threonine-protein kinase
MTKPTTPDPSDTARGERLDSWKEIAAYLKRDVRTAQRWEKQERLPVHRHLHDERATTYAFAREIDQWLADRRQLGSDPSPHGEFVRQHDAFLRLARWPLVILVVTALVASISWWRGAREGGHPMPLSTLSVTFDPSERFREWGPELAMSPDGSTLAYSAMSPGIRIRRFDQLESRDLTGTDGGAPFFSPDGRWIGFIRGGQLMKIPASGGTAVPLGATVNFLGSADWGADDFIVYAAVTPEGRHGLYRAPADGGSPQLVTALDGDADDVYWLTPQSVANGKIILCTLTQVSDTGPRFQIVAVTVSTGQRRVLVDDARHALYLGDDVLVYLRDQTLFATRFDLDRLEFLGPHVPAWDNIFQRVRLRSWTSAAGTLVYWPGLRVGRRLVWVDRDGKQQPLPLPPRLYLSPRLSPDGQRIAFGLSESSEFGDIWTYDVASGATSQVTTDGRSGTPLWTPDGRSIVFSAVRASGRELFRLNLGVATQPQPIRLPAEVFTGQAVEPATWADAGNTLLVRSPGLRDTPFAWAVTLDGNLDPSPVLPRRLMRGNHFRVSPDGRWIAYEGGDERTDVFVAPLRGGRPSWKVSTEGGALPVWSRNGRELFYRHDDRMMVVPVTTGATFTAGTPRVLFEGRYFEADPGSPNYDVTPDGQRFLMVLAGATEGPDRLNVVQGWKADIMRRLGVSR